MSDNHAKSAALFSRWIVGVAFLVAAAFKLFKGWALFVKVIATILTAGHLNAAAAVGGVVIAFELGIALALVLGVQQRWTSILAGAFLVTATALFISNHNLIRDGCACMWRVFGGVPERTEVMMRNSMLLLLCAVSWVMSSSPGARGLLTSAGSRRDKPEGL